MAKESLSLGETSEHVGELANVEVFSCTLYSDFWRGMRLLAYLTKNAVGRLDAAVLDG